MYPGTLIERVLSHGLSPINCIFNKLSLVNSQNCGVVDSLKVLLSREQFLKPYSEEHVLVGLLTRAF